MSDTTTAPPAANGGLTLEQVSKTIQEAVAQATKGLSDTVATLQGELKAVAEGHAALQAGQKALQEAQGKALTREAADKAIADKVAALQAASAQDTAKTQAKAAVRAKVLAARLPGVPEALLASLPDTDDEAKLTAAADGLRKTIEDGFKTKLPDVGGAAKDGGQTAAAPAPPKFTATNSGLTEGEAGFASAIKLPR